MTTQELPQSNAPEPLAQGPEGAANADQPASAAAAPGMEAAAAEGPAAPAAEEVNFGVSQEPPLADANAEIDRQTGEPSLDEVLLRLGRSPKDDPPASFARRKEFHRIERARWREKKAKAEQEE